MSGSGQNLTGANRSNKVILDRANFPSDYATLLMKLQPTDGSDIFGEFPKKFLPTLPPKFRSLLDTPISIESDKPQEVIKLLGNLLGIADYATNMPSFWFLDTLALHVLRHKQDLDEYYTSVLVSWLAGEIGLLRDRKHTRKEFFREMRHIFVAAASKISEQKRVPYWKEIVSYERDTEEETEEETEEQVSTRSESLESLRDPSSREGFKLHSNVDPIFALDIVIEATYSMYANELRYALVYAVFVEPIEVRTYDLPFAIRTPRPVKLADPKMIPFNVELQKNLRKTETTEKFKKSRKTGKSGKKNFEVPMTPPCSLDDETMLTCNRLFILPLIEAKEAAELFDTDDV